MIIPDGCKAVIHAFDGMQCICVTEMVVDGRLDDRCNNVMFPTILVCHGTVLASVP